MNILKKLFAFVQLHEAVRRADKEHERNHARYYVMPSRDGKLVVIDRKNFKILRMKRYIPSHATQRDMLNECFYFTPYRDGSGLITKEARKIKTEQYFSWKEASLKRNDKRR